MKKNNLYIRKISIGTSEGYTLLDFDSILYIQSQSNYSVFYLSDDKKIIASKNLGYFEKRLSENLFLRIHNNTIINLEKVIKYKKGDGGQVIMNNNKFLHVSRNKKNALLQFLKQLC